MIAAFRRWRRRRAVLKARKAAVRRAVQKRALLYQAYAQAATKRRTIHG